MSTHAPVPHSPTAVGTKSKANHTVRNQSLFMLIIGAFFTLFTYQYFHHGLWGKMTNYNKLPLIQMQGTTVQNDQLNLTLYRPNGPDTYGSFVEKVTVSVPGTKQPVQTWTPSTLSKVASADIHNVFKFQQVKTGPWGLVVPLSAKATVQLPLDSNSQAALSQAGKALVTVEDVSGTKWSYTAAVK